tara:strand:- start:2104 stop:2481 length:378 start_codon:yes stop_codon:yes gene_type:complete
MKKDANKNIALKSSLKTGINLKKFLVSSGNWSKVVELPTLSFDKSYDMAIEAMTIATELFLKGQHDGFDVDGDEDHLSLESSIRAVDIDHFAEDDYNFVALTKNIVNNTSMSKYVEEYESLTNNQ